MQRRYFMKALFAAGACPVCFRLAWADDDEDPSRRGEDTSDYEGGSGPSHWGELDKEYLACSEGTQQSPLDIHGEVSAELPELAPAWRRSRGQMVNNGHTIQINLPHGSTTRRGGDVFELLQFHFHAPSEHHVRAEVFPIEAHFVHKQAGTQTLGVLAVFLVPGKTNVTFAQLAAAFPQTSGMEVPVRDLDPAGLLPSPLDYWCYQGSLTTPPCSEDVDWMIAQSPVEVSRDDIARFTSIYPMNARPIRPAHRRFILSSS